MEVLGELVRCRILLSCEQQELTVSELCTVLQLPQSTVSRHLKTLLEDGWVAAHKDGTSRLYSARQRSSPVAPAMRTTSWRRESIRTASVPVVPLTAMGTKSVSKPTNRRQSTRPSEAFSP